MRNDEPTTRLRRMAALALGLTLMAVTPARGEYVRLKNGQTFRGLVDKDGTLVQVYDYDGRWRVILRDTKIAAIENDSPPDPVKFDLIQPLTVHAGELPAFAHHIETTPWDQFGRRKFRYVGTRSGKATEMTQAIYQMKSHAVRIRGVDGFWNAPLALECVPREVVLGLLAKVDQKDQDKRLSVGSFLIQAGWYGEARAELERIARDFPELQERVATVKRLVAESAAREKLTEIDRRRQGQQPREVLARLRSFPLDDAPPEILTTVRDQLRSAEAQHDDDRALADAVARLADELTPEARREVEGRLLEILRVLSEAPDAVRDRLAPFRKAEGSLTPEQKFALVLSAWVVGADAAVTDMAAADMLWDARELVRAYLVSTDAAARAALLGQLQSLSWPASDDHPPRSLDLPTVTAMARLMPPPFHDEQRVSPGQARLVRIHDDPNPRQPTEYAVLLPSEYHPLRSYPVVVALHGEESPIETIGWLAEQAQQRGYIVIAPEYNLRDQQRVYRYTPSEHAAVELALRDARRRFAIDSNRVFLVGQIEGGNMAWDLGLAHPDLFAGVVVISGLPGKYVWSSRTQAPLVPMYIVMGELAPTEDPIVFEQWAKPQIMHNSELIYVKYFRRGLEALPEEAPQVFDWMTGRRRDPSPKEFEAATARDCDVRFFGVVIREFSPRRTVAPEAADPLGRNLRAAKIEFRANNVLNKLVVDTSGVLALDVWVNPDTLEFDKRVEVQLNGKSIYRDVPKLDALEPFLEDLRIRGDRQQVYWLRVSARLGRGRF